MDAAAPQGAHHWRLCVAPMLDLTDKHCRHFHRLLTKRVRLYTEMVTTGALLHGAVRRHLRHDEGERPLALQLGGSEPRALAACARLGEEWGYDEINLNCGCPSPRVQRGAFGAALMLRPQLVAQCLRAMQDATSLPVTVKHRIGIDGRDDYAFVRDFVGTLADTGCRTFIVHARSAWLQGLSPKENRDVPPLRYDVAQQLKRDFPHLVIVVNGGIASNDAIAAHLQHMDGAMLGRAAYYQPLMLREWDARFFGAAPCALSIDEIEEDMLRYMQREAAEDGTPWTAIARHMLGLRHGQRGARAWRQVWSNAHLKHLPPAEVHALAQQKMREMAQRTGEKSDTAAINM